MVGRQAGRRQGKCSTQAGHRESRRGGQVVNEAAGPVAMIAAAVAAVSAGVVAALSRLRRATLFFLPIVLPMLGELD